MATMTQLVTYVDLEDPDAPDWSFSARLEAVLAGGPRIVLLDDRGWGGTGGLVDEIRETALMVTGPDEPFDDRTEQDMADEHFAALSETLRHRGVAISPDELARLPHEVELSKRLRAFLRRK